MSNVATRYAPSPTGVPHIGNIRTALFNFLYARNQKGKFILRIEDTDRKRVLPSSIPQIKESLMVLNLKWDELYVQSERLDLYVRSLEFLKSKKLVYQEDKAWRLRVPKDKKIGWHDIVHGKVEFDSNVIEDFVVMKSDGFPTYHFASVVDDHHMQVTHVLRGDEWISSTPKHLLLYEAFSWTPPILAHLPPIVSQHKKKLSKREGARSVIEYIEEGYLPEALVNFLVLLGWAPKGDRELFTLDELIWEFSLNRLNKNSPIFNIEKLDWFNIQWIKRLEENELANRIRKLFRDYEIARIKPLIPLVRERMRTLSEFKKIAEFFFSPPSFAKIPNVSVSAATIVNLANSFKETHGWSAETIKGIIEASAKTENVDRIELIASVRNIVSGSAVTPPLYESLEKLGKGETIKRLNEYAKKSRK